MHYLIEIKYIKFCIYIYLFILSFIHFYRLDQFKILFLFINMINSLFNLNILFRIKFYYGMPLYNL